MIKSLNRLGIQEVYFNNNNKKMYDKTIANTMCSDEKLKAFPQRSGTKRLDKDAQSFHFY